MKMESKVFTDIDKLSAAAVEKLFEIMDDAVRERGAVCDLALRRTHSS